MTDSIDLAGQELIHGCRCLSHMRTSDLIYRGTPPKLLVESMALVLRSVESAKARGDC